MIASRVNLFVVAMVFVLGLVVGCSRESGPPEALPLAEVVPALQKAFAKAKPDSARLVEQVVAAVQAKEYPKAFAGVNYLLSQPELTQEQLSVLARASLTLNEVIQKAQSQGDQKAAQTPKPHEVNK